MLGFSERIPYITEDLQLLQEVIEQNRFTVEGAISRIIVSCKEILKRCKWHGEIKDCMQLFRESYTFDGYCCSFNSDPLIGVPFKSKRAKKFGLANGLSLVLEPALESNSSYNDGVRVRIFDNKLIINNLCFVFFKLIIHEYSSYPSDTSIVKMLAPRTENIASINAELTFCSTALNALPISDRQCALPEEIALKYVETVCI